MNMDDKQRDLYVRAARDALEVQSACNLSGVVHAFSRAMKILCELSYHNNKGTDWKNKHPIAYLFSVQIGYLSGSGSLNTPTYRTNYEICEQIAKGNLVY